MEADGKGKMVPINKRVLIADTPFSPRTKILRTHEAQLADKRAAFATVSLYVA